MRLPRLLLSTILVAGIPVAVAAQAPDSAALAHSIAELRHVIGTWDVTTTFLNPDGSVAGEPKGTYEFRWVVPDAVVSGTTTIPELHMTAAILFYVRPDDAVIEMVSVGGDGKLWIMTGPLGGDTRSTAPYTTPEGGTMMLRFTRSNVEPDRFESKMEHSSDGGTTWVEGNHQVFVRRSP